MLLDRRRGAAAVGGRRARRHGRARRRAAAARAARTQPPGAAGSARSRRPASARWWRRCARSGSRSGRSRSRCRRSPTRRAGRSSPACCSRSGRDRERRRRAGLRRAAAAPLARARAPAHRARAAAQLRAAGARRRRPPRWRCSCCRPGALIAPLIATRNELAGRVAPAGRGDRGLHVAADRDGGRDRGRRRGGGRARGRGELAGGGARRRRRGRRRARRSRPAAARRWRPRRERARRARAMAPFLVAAGAMFAVHVLDAGDPARPRPRVRRLPVAGRAEHLGRDRRARASARWFWGPLSDRIGRRASLVLAERARSSCRRCSSAFAPSFGALLALRALQGLCMPGLITVGRAVRRPRRTRRRSGRGRWATTSPRWSPAGCVGRVGVALLTAATSWRVALGALALLPLASTLLMRRGSRAEPSEGRRTRAALARAAARVLRQPGADRRDARAAARCSSPSRAPSRTSTSGSRRRRSRSPRRSSGLVFLVWVMGAAGPGGRADRGAARLARGRARRPRARGRRRGALAVGRRCALVARSASR